MKTFVRTARALLAAIVLLPACDEAAVELPVLTDNDYPRILGRWPEKTGDRLGEFGTSPDHELVVTLQFTPASLCEGTWYLDGVEYCKGTTFAYYTVIPEVHNLKLVVTTPRYTTTREAILRVE